MTSSSASLLDIAADAVTRAARAGATAADALCVESTDLSVTQRLGKQEALERAESKALGLRVWVGDAQAIVSSTDMSSNTIDGLVERVMAMAKNASSDQYSTLAPQASLATTFPELDLLDAKEPTARHLQEQCARAEDVALGVKGITNSEGADAHYSRRNVALATSHGFAHHYQSSSHSLSLSVLAGSDTGMERDYEYSVARHAGDLMSPEAIGKSAAERTLARLNPRKIDTCQVPVVLDPRVARELLGAFAGAISGSAIARGTSFLKDAMGTDIFGAGITITDDPHRKRGLASRPFDGEGVANKKRALVERGVLQSWLLDVRSANRLGLASTGHASRGVGSPPSPSSSNLTLEAGTLPPSELIKDIKRGFFVTEAFGMGVNLITGDYSQGASGIWIENGELTYAVSELTIAGRMQDMLKNLTPANDLEFHHATNSPTLRIDGMTVAGK